jgi:hypothetical protein
VRLSPFFSPSFSASETKHAWTNHDRMILRRMLHDSKREGKTASE